MLFSTCSYPVRGAMGMSSMVPHLNDMKKTKACHYICLYNILHVIGTCHRNFLIVCGAWKWLNVTILAFRKQQVAMARDGQSRFRHGFRECSFYLNVCRKVWAEGQGRRLIRRCRGGWSYVLHKVNKNITTVNSFSFFPHYVCSIFYWTCCSSSWQEDFTVQLLPGTFIF